MAFYDTTWYCNAGDQSTTGYYAVAKRPQNTAVVAAQLCRQFTAPAVGSERCFVCIVAGTTANTTDATWVLTRGAKTTDGTATWQECTGIAAVNGDATNTVTWAQAKATGAPTLGAIIKRNNGASYWMCSTAGALGASEPAWANDTAGTTQADSTTTWTCLGVVGNFTGGQAPHARLANVFGSNWWAAGNTIYIGDNHAESGTTITLSPQSALLSKVICHNHSGSYPPGSGNLATTATITASSSIGLNMQGPFYFYGITFGGPVPGNMGICNSSGSNANAPNWCYFDNCSFAPLSGANGGLALGPGGSSYCDIIWNNCTVKLGTTAAYVNPQSCKFTWQNTGAVLASGSSVPTGATALIEPGTPAQGRVTNIVLEALDLSQITGNLFNSANSTTLTASTVIVRDCKLNASTTIATPAGSEVVELVRSDSGATAYKSARYAYEGTETTETSITRVGGAVDPTGQVQTRKIITTANSQWLKPFKAEPYAIWNSTTGANVTVTVYGTLNAGAVPFNDDIWLEVGYLGSSATPLGTIVTTTKASVLAANAAVASDSSSWNGGGSGAGWSPFKLVATLSSPQPGLAGYIDVRVRAAKASTTYYIDPKIELT